MDWKLFSLAPFPLSPCLLSPYPFPALPGDRSWLLNTILQEKGPGLLGEMADSKAVAGKNQDELGIPVAPESEEAPKKPRGHDEKAQGPT